jgi:menaquinone-dependent protoporphyrinogen oxidase
MKPVAVFYATREGHTHKIAERVADDLRKRGFEAAVKNLRDDDAITLSDYAGAILAASVHIGTHEPEMVAFVKQHRAELESMPSAFLSVTLSEVGAERANATVEEHARFVADVQGMLNRFFEDTGWHPQRVKPVAGALLYTKYNFLICFVMRRIAKKAGAETDTSRDYEYTDWVALDHFVDEVADEISRSIPGPGA